ncbi:MAG TPA: hypothetical protein VHQ65_10920, partial [Thermoanaerobaculia bacterium]|nr:hypothetical protein [Thermoanaerobaculia bacterium]
PGLGLATALLALPWNPPLLAPSLGPAVRAGALPALAAFAALGLGLALPWLLVAARPELLRRAPRARFAHDGWGRHLAEALAFLEVGSVLWLLYVLARQVSPEALAFLQLALLGLALSAWLRHGARRRVPAVALTGLMVILAAMILWLADGNRLTPDADRGATLEATTNPGDR